MVSAFKAGLEDEDAIERPSWATNSDRKRRRGELMVQKDREDKMDRKQFVVCNESIKLDAAPVPLLDSKYSRKVMGLH